MSDFQLWFTRALAFFSASLLLTGASRCSVEPMTVEPGLLAFAVTDEQGALLVINTEGELVKVYPIHNFTPQWSPDGRLMLDRLTVDLEGEQTLEWETGQLQTIAPSLPGYWDASWGPDGETFVFVQGEGLYLAHTGDSGFVRLLKCTWQCRHVAWSPDGEKIAFVEKDYGSTHLAEDDVRYLKVFYMADETVEVLLTLHSGEDRWAPQPYVASLDWSPDSTKLAFIGAMDQENRGGLYTLDINSGELHLVVPDPGPAGLARITHMQSTVSWSPNGSQIAYAWVVEDSSDIYYNEIRVVDVETLESVTVWREDNPIRLRSGPDWRGEH